MKPKFAQFLRFIYPNYKSHPSVERNSSIQLCEMKDDMIMFDHHEPETRMLSLSYTNGFEASMIIQFVAYLTKIGVKNTTITVISMYLDQVFQIKNKLKELKIKNVRVTTVDSF
jgi:hypothetical protein